MRIEKNTYDKNYPYTICDAWGGRACLTEEDLKELYEELKIMLDK